jgi:anti-anti-sigma factor
VVPARRLVSGFVSPYSPTVTLYELEVRDHDLGAVSVVALSGEIDLTNAIEVERRLEQVAGEGGLILDLNRVVFVDSAALHMLFRIARRVQSAERFGIVLEPTALVARTLTRVGIDEVATVRPTVDELVAEPA